MNNIPSVEILYTPFAVCGWLIYLLIVISLKYVWKIIYEWYVLLETIFGFIFMIFNVAVFGGFSTLVVGILYLLYQDVYKIK